MYIAPDPRTVMFSVTGPSSEMVDPPINLAPVTTSVELPGLATILGPSMKSQIIQVEALTQSMLAPIVTLIDNTSTSVAQSIERIASEGLKAARTATGIVESVATMGSPIPAINIPQGIAMLTGTQLGSIISSLKKSIFTIQAVKVMADATMNAWPDMFSNRIAAAATWAAILANESLASPIARSQTVFVSQKAVDAFNIKAIKDKRAGRPYVYLQEKDFFHPVNDKGPMNWTTNAVPTTLKKSEVTVPTFNPATRIKSTANIPVSEISYRSSAMGAFQLTQSNVTNISRLLNKLESSNYIARLMARIGLPSPAPTTLWSSLGAHPEWQLPYAAYLAADACRILKMNYSYSGAKGWVMKKGVSSNDWSQFVKNNLIMRGRDTGAAALMHHAWAHGATSGVGTSKSSFDHSSVWVKTPILAASLIQAGAVHQFIS